MRILGLHAFAAERDDFGAIKEDVNGALHVPALDDHGGRAHLHDLPRRRFHICHFFYDRARQNLGFRNIRGNDARALQQFRRDVFDSARIEELRSARRPHHRVEHHLSKLVRLEKFSHNHGIAPVAQHADFHGSDVAIIHQCFELRAQFRARRVVNGFNSFGVLDGE